ncbi:glutamine amidotransferase-related protein [Novosphingobium cyanobacteriorum]|uniref:Gamma-glutamyl-gamma-aminobutyrate hydrolase family protein n=1 Tax=Novosphingobium cyanobacteriorum TaxID=3024215 RepID=A0ABT6CIM9_9SPHN|nr:gamma-glutamyl-gamma-aminobutyrate hydrolase family protein [Novosphingobium cyanobacteriorum]MDF8333770.1 gamma-glutamyl-gamma-aminobutyrate hydrolase family protein [Novosphingobium cyanobacteriorum]
MTTIGILECGRNKPEWLAEHGGFADWFPPLLNPVAPDLDYRVWRVIDGEIPNAPDQCDAWLLTGSPASTYANEPWQQQLSQFVIKAREHRPIVGICYGHQHLHAALGGRVEKASHWGVGITRYDIGRQPPWLDSASTHLGADHFDLIALHQDQVTVPAPDTQVLASSPDCPLAVTMIGPNILTFQPHPEMTPDQVTLIYDLHRDDMGEELWRRAQDSLDQPRNAQLAARWIVDFLRSNPLPPTQSTPSGDAA